MGLLTINNFQRVYNFKVFIIGRHLTQSCTSFDVKEISNNIKRQIESHWKEKVNKGQFNVESEKNKFYVLSMFPYPSGNLHMGHVRVYAISDAMARFYRMTGKNVFHPMGWDAFGLPAENAAIERKVEPSDWTNENIAQMKEQLNSLGCSFDWDHEVSTCNENYYKWTQKIFLMLYEKGLIYQNEALVNWDPIDKTVLADEQVDTNGCSWRSGAKVEKKLLKQWFVRTTKFAKALLDGLNDPTLEHWRDIINLQRHWIGECDGYVFYLDIKGEKDSTKFTIRLWTRSPEYLMDPNAFVALKNNHYLHKTGGKELRVYNPFTKQLMPLVFTEKVVYPEHCDTYIGAPSFNEEDRNLCDCIDLPFKSDPALNLKDKNYRKYVLDFALSTNIGGYEVSSKLQDWLISRQRYWGTPIPIVHCNKCGAVPVDEQHLPVLLPAKNVSLDVDDKLDKVTCPKCSNPNARRETDTMDTFVDSSWYYLRFLDSQNKNEVFDKKLIGDCMPVDLYIGGKEHAVLHLYYARFMNHFLHSLGLVPYPEPFKRLLVQGMVMGRSYRVKGYGKYLKEDEVEIVDAKKNKAVEKSTGSPVHMAWEKMSKSKLNGVDPTQIISEYGCDTTRLIILGDVAPMSHRNWSTATFPGILNWQNRLWLTINDYHDVRNNPQTESVDVNSKEFLLEDEKLFDARNYYAKGVTFNFLHTHQLSVGISKMQGLTNSLRRAPKNVIKFGKQYERALACQLIMLSPMAPHFASELWSKFVSTPGRLNENSDEIQWKQDVLNQRWPEVDMEYCLDLTIKINGFENAVIKILRRQLDILTYNEALDIAFNTESVTSYLRGKKIKATNFVNYKGCEAILNIYLDKVEKHKTGRSIEEKIVNK